MAWELWYLESYQYKESDEEIEHFLTVTKTTGWLKKARMAMFLTAQSVAKKMKIHRSAYSRFENNESSMTLETLNRCAEAMDCELVYAIRPKSRKIFSESIREKINCNSNKEIKEQIYDPEFRRAKGWSKNNDPEAHGTVRDLKTMRYMGWNMVRNGANDWDALKNWRAAEGWRVHKNKCDDED